MLELHDNIRRECLRCLSAEQHNTDLGSNEALAHEMKEYAKLFNNIDTKVEFVCQDLQALWADSEHGPRVKSTGNDDASLSCGRYHGVS